MGGPPYTAGIDDFGINDRVAHYAEPHRCGRIKELVSENKGGEKTWRVLWDDGKVDEVFERLLVECAAGP